MRYTIVPHAPVSSISTNGTLSLALAEQVTGEVSFFFSLGSDKSEYHNRFTVLPLFLAEFKQFLEQVDRSHFTCWRWGFAPFAFGKIIKNSLIISSRPNERFFDSAYSSISPEDLKMLETQLDADLARFGFVNVK